MLLVLSFLISLSFTIKELSGLYVRNKNENLPMLFYFKILNYMVTEVYFLQIN